MSEFMSSLQKSIFLQHCVSAEGKCSHANKELEQIVAAAHDLSFKHRRSLSRCWSRDSFYVRPFTEFAIKRG